MNRLQKLTYPKPIGPIYQDGFNGSASPGTYTLSANWNTGGGDIFTRDGSGDLTIKNNTGVGSFNYWVTFDYQITAEKWVRNIPFKFTAGSGGAGAIAFGLMSYQVGAVIPSQEFLCAINSADATNPNRGKIQWAVGNSFTQFSSGAIPLAVNDECSLRIERVDAITFTATYINHTQALSISDTFSLFNFNYPQTYIKPTNSKPAIWCFGGTFLLHDDELNTSIHASPDYLFIGDSITFGNFAGGISARWAALVGDATKKTYVIEAGPGDRSGEVVGRILWLRRIKAKTAILAIGSNDAAAGISTTTFENNLRTIITNLQAVGTRVILCKILPRISTTTAPYNDKIELFNNNLIIDTHTPFTSGGVEDTQNSSYFTADNVHPNASGHTLFADTVLAQPI